MRELQPHCSPSKVYITDMGRRIKMPIFGAKMDKISVLAGCRSTFLIATDILRCRWHRNLPSYCCTGTIHKVAHQRIQCLAMYASVVVSEDTKYNVEAITSIYLLDTAEF